MIKNTKMKICRDIAACFSYFPAKRITKEGGIFYCNDACTWENCREILSYDFEYADLLFSYPKINLKTFNDFFEKIEKSMGLKGRTVINLTDIDSVINITPAKYWRQGPIEWSFFTLFVRCAAVYYKGNFNKAISNYKLTNKIKYTINRLVSGHIKFIVNTPISLGIVGNALDYDDFVGCVDLFSNLSKRDIDFSLA